MSDHKKLIWAEDAIEALTDDLSYYGAGNEAAYGMSRAIGIIEKLPPAQSEIIRCRECKHMQEDKIFHQCWCNGNEVKYDHFCGYAERRQDGQTN